MFTNETVKTKLDKHNVDDGCVIQVNIEDVQREQGVDK